MPFHEGSSIWSIYCSDEASLEKRGNWDSYYHCPLQNGPHSYCTNAAHHIFREIWFSCLVWRISIHFLYNGSDHFADSPIFIVANVLLLASPPALSLTQITQVASGAFERLISRTIFWSYYVVTPPTTIIFALIGLILAKLWESTWFWVSLPFFIWSWIGLSG